MVYSGHCTVRKAFTANPSLQKQENTTIRIIPTFYFTLFPQHDDRIVHCTCCQWRDVLPRIDICTADQPEERTILCLKRRDYFMHCSHCTLLTRVYASTVQSSNGPYREQSVPSTASAQLTSNGDANPVRITRRIAPNNSVQLSDGSHPQRDVCVTLRHQLILAKQNQSRRLDTYSISHYILFAISNRAHDFPPALACFTVLGSAPHNLYRIITFDKLHVVDLGII